MDVPMAQVNAAHQKVLTRKRMHQGTGKRHISEGVDTNMDAPMAQVRGAHQEVLTCKKSCQGAGKRCIARGVDMQKIMPRH
ncbi:hypothetical protein KI387_005120, partial [Taxus chinensis]